MEEFGRDGSEIYVPFFFFFLYKVEDKKRKQKFQQKLTKKT